VALAIPVSSERGATAEWPPTRTPGSIEMSCPFLKEVVMLYCDACPFKKLLPLERLASAQPCLGGDFERCRVFQEVARLMEEGEAGGLTPAGPAPAFPAGSDRPSGGRH
jgi:hypothetical protein